MMVIIPPAAYDHAPSMPVIEHVMSAAEVDKHCHTLKGAPDGLILGCSLRNKNDGKCYILYSGAPELRRHERAHCNGWGHDHPGGKWQEVR